jgi:hypothetical protein
MSRVQHYPESTPSAGTKQTGDEDLAARIRSLQAERGRHLQAIADIDKILGEVENVLTDLDMPLPNTDEPRRRRYQKLEMTGEESVLDFIRNHGNPTTAQVNAHWQQEGRPGVANPILARLLKRGVLLRENDPAVRGSRYRINP